MIAAIRRGDTVVTSGGILGKVTKVDDAGVAGRDRRRGPRQACARDGV